MRQKGRQVCSCFGVEAPAIEGHLAQCGGSAQERLVSLLEAPVADDAASSTGTAAGKRKRLGRSLKDFSPE